MASDCLKKYYQYHTCTIKGFNTQNLNEHLLLFNIHNYIYFSNLRDFNLQAGL